MLDRPDFYKQSINWPQSNWRSERGEAWIWFLTLTNLAAGGDYTNPFYTIPSGKKVFTTDICIGGDFKGYGKFYYGGGNQIFYTFFDAYHPIQHTSNTPPLGNAGEPLTYYLKNEDSVTGNARMTWLTYLLPASKPPEPKNDDPEEILKTGAFISAEVLSNPFGDDIYILTRLKTPYKYYLRFKNFGTPKQKKLASLHLRPNEAEEIINIVRDKPEKVKAILEKYEKKMGKFIKI